MNTKTINVNELQSGISKVLKDVQDGDVFEVMRYSEPFAVVLSYDNYLMLKGECRKCVQELREVAEIVKKGKKKSWEYIWITRRQVR